MQKSVFFIFAVVVSAATFFDRANADHIWINEFHYDNTGTDGNEFVEIAFRSGEANSIGDYNLVLYNANGGVVYNTTDLATATQGLTVPIANDTRSVTFYRVSFPSNGIQNGGNTTTPAADGLALSLKSNNSLVGTFLSYEGTFTATDGPASGVLSTDIGVFEDGTSPAPPADTGSLSLVGVGLAAADFTWANTAISTSTSGSSTVNSGQTLAAAIPEPASAIVLALGFAGLTVTRRRK